MSTKNLNSEIGKIHNIEICMLEFFQEYAKKEKLVYYMAGGTLLGAVRHKGFIPWDDDVDLMMPRPDYNRFIRTFKDKRYKLSNCEYKPEYNIPHSRLWDSKTKLKWTSMDQEEIGVFVDIFPIDGFPKNEIQSRLHQIHLKILRTFLNASIRRRFVEGEKYKMIKNVLKRCIHHSGNYYAKRINKLAQKYDYSRCEYVGVKTTTDHLFKEKNNKSIFKETVYLPFENLMLPAPCGYDIYLRHLYGNYLELPPKDEQHSEHQITVEFNCNDLQN